MKRKILKFILDFFGLEEYLDGMAYEIKCNKYYIDHLENEFIPRLEKKINDLTNHFKIEKQAKQDLLNLPVIIKQDLEKDLLKNEIEELKKVNKKLYQLRGEFSADKWISCKDMLPNISIPELLVTDGKLSSVASFDIHTKSFLRVYGSQTMKIPNPTAWQLIPAPHDDKIELYQSPKIMLRQGLDITYIRD